MTTVTSASITIAYVMHDGIVLLIWLSDGFLLSTNHAYIPISGIQFLGSPTRWDEHRTTLSLKENGSRLLLRSAKALLLLRGKTYSDRAARGVATAFDFAGCPMPAERLHQLGSKPATVRGDLAAGSRQFRHAGAEDRLRRYALDAAPVVSLIKSALASAASSAVAGSSPSATSFPVASDHWRTTAADPGISRCSRTVRLALTAFGLTSTSGGIGLEGHGGDLARKPNGPLRDPAAVTNSLIHAT